MTPMDPARLANGPSAHARAVWMRDAHLSGGPARINEARSATTSRSRSATA